MTRPPTAPSDAAPASVPARAGDRRALGRAVVAGLAAAAVAPLLADPAAAEEAVGTAAERGTGRKWHRCKVHRRHTCRRARTCRHRRHRPPPPDDGGSSPAVPPTGTPPPLGSYTSPAAVGGLPTLTALHLASRLTFGMTPGLLAEMSSHPTVQAWWDAQLQPSSIDDQAAEAIETWWPSLGWSAQTMWAQEQAGTGAAWRAMADYQRWCLMRRTYSRRQVLESVTEFFENHLHVPVHDDGVFGFRTDYGRTIRRHALGRFDQMLVAAITHPAMGISLDNATSTKTAPNENLGRELLELHTVGRGSFTEDDVKNSARILTGYRVTLWSTWNVYYHPTSHWTGPVQVMGFSHANADPDGRAVTEAYLTYLAHHPATARRLARKLAVRYVSDAPSAALVDHLADVYLAAGTAIVPVLRALVEHPEFLAARGTKVRNPSDDVVATWRVLDVRAAAPTSDDSAANAMLWQTVNVGQAPFDWARPDGQPEDGDSWSSVSRLLASFETHYSMCGGWWPKRDLAYHPVASWVPLAAGESMRFDALVDHLSRRLLARSSTTRLLEACCLASGLTPATAITPTHNLVRWGMPVLLTTVLDSPEHLSR
jgi:uncharacterized protein (DUF1800 family)